MGHKFEGKSSEFVKSAKVKYNNTLIMMPRLQENIENMISAMQKSLEWNICRSKIEKVVVNTGVGRIAKKIK